MLGAAPGPLLCAETTKLMNWLVGTGSGLATKEVIIRSAGGVGVGVGEGDGLGVGVGVGVGGGVTPVEVQFRVMLPNSLFQPSTAIR